MSSTGKEIRLRRLFSGGKALVVAMDHGVSSGPVAGLEDIRKAVANAAKGGATLIVRPQKGDLDLARSQEGWSCERSFMLPCWPSWRSPAADPRMHPKRLPLK